MAEKKIVAVNMTHIRLRYATPIIQGTMLAIEGSGIPVLKMSHRKAPYFIETRLVRIEYIVSDYQLVGTRWDMMYDFSEETMKQRMGSAPVFEGSLIDYIKKVEEERKVTVSELQCKLTDFMINDCRDYSINIDGFELTADAIGLDHLQKQMTIRPAHYKSPQYDAAKKLDKAINVAIEHYFDDCRR